MAEQFAETAVLVAVLHSDIAEADHLLDDFLPGELDEFQRQALMLADCIAEARRRKMRERAG